MSYHGLVKDILYGFSSGSFVSLSLFCKEGWLQLLHFFLS